MSVPGLWRMDAQSGHFLYLPLEQIENWYGYDRILFPHSGQSVPIEEQLERVALGLGYAILPEGTARFYHRRDIRYRHVAGLDEVQVALAQHKARPMPEFDRLARIARRLLGEVA